MGMVLCPVDGCEKLLEQSTEAEHSGAGRQDGLLPWQSLCQCHTARSLHPAPESVHYETIVTRRLS